MGKRGLTGIGIALLVSFLAGQGFAQSNGGAGGGMMNGGLEGMDGMMGHGWVMHDELLYGNFSGNAGPDEAGVFPDGSSIHVIMPDQFDGYHHVVYMQNGNGNIVAVVLQPDGQLGRHWDENMQTYISEAFMEWMGDDHYQLYTRDRDHEGP
jgi:hypothetical protein